MNNSGSNSNNSPSSNPYGNFLPGVDGNPYVEVYSLPAPIHGHDRIASVVIDSEAFDRLLDDLLPRKLSSVDQNVWEENVAKMRYLRCIPAVGRGDKTEWMFEKYGIDPAVMVMGVIVRGQASEIVKRFNFREPARKY